MHLKIILVKKINDNKIIAKITLKIKPIL